MANKSSIIFYFIIIKQCENTQKEINYEEAKEATSFKKLVELWIKVPPNVILTPVFAALYSWTVNAN